LHCPKCQTWNPPYFNFCLECGTHFGHPPPDPFPKKRNTPSGLYTVRGQFVVPPITITKNLRGPQPHVVTGAPNVTRSPAGPDEALWLTVVAAALTTFVFVATLLVLFG